MEAPGTTDGGPGSTSETSEVSEHRQLQDSPQEEAACRVNSSNHAQQRHLRRLVRLVVWMTMFYILPRFPRADAHNLTDLSWLDEDVPWIPLVTAFTPVSFDKILGRWYVVEDYSPRSTFQIPINEWFDISFDENGLLAAQWFQKTEEGYVLRPHAPIRVEPPPTPEFDDEESYEYEPGLQYEVMNFSLDEGYLSLAVCAGRRGNCTTLLLTRDATEAGGDVLGALERVLVAALTYLEHAAAAELTPCTYNDTDSRMHCSF